MQKSHQVAEGPISPNRLGYDFAIHEGMLFFEGVNLRSLVMKHGSPLFVFSERKILDNIRRIRSAFSAKIPKLRISYAVKAASSLRVLRTVREQGVGAEVSSEGEIFLALMAGFNPGNIIFNGPAKSDRELAIAAKLGLHCINLDSLDELERLNAVCKRLGKVARISFRFRPDVGAGTKMIQTGTAESKFGLGTADVIEAYGRAANLRDCLKIVGIHAHVGSQNTSLDSWADYVKKLTGLAARIKKEFQISIQHINIGGGLPAKYATDELNQPTPSHTKSVPSDEEIADTVAQALSEGGARGLELIIEPGRRIVANAALLVTRVISTKTSGGQDWIYVDAGFNTLPSVRMPWYYHMLPITKADERELTPYRVAGPLCDGHDLFHDLDGEEQGLPSLPKYRMLPRGFRAGHLLAILDVGAYSVDIMDNFNGRLLAGAAFIDKHGRTSVMRRHQTHEDLLHYQLHSKAKVDNVMKKMANE
jgi:diaminopimelate decarboxylase